MIRHSFSELTAVRTLGRVLLSGLSLAGLLMVSPTGAWAQLPFNNVVAFGDSLSDNGNAYAIAGNTIPAPPYFEGRLSNGPVWVEQFAASLGVPLTDFAVAGAYTDDTNLSNNLPGVPPGTFPFAGIQTQVNGYLTATSGVADPNALYVIWGGANDYLNGFQSNPAIPVGNITSHLTSLIAAGARQFLVPNLPDLGSIPGTSGTIFSGPLNTLTAFHNAGLATAIGGLRTAFPTVQITLLDVNTLFKNVIADGAAFGFANVTERYIDGQGQLPGVNPLVVGTGDPNSYLFWDEVHPTAAGHQLVANLAVSAVAPEPGTLGLVTLGGISLLALVRRRRNSASIK